jgi:DNA-binding response OmpR family regulator
LNRTVAVINSHADTVEALRIYLERAGFTTVAAVVEPSKYGLADFIDLVRRQDPAVVLYNVSIPLQENWALVKLLMDFERRKGRRFILTTTNTRMLETLVGDLEIEQVFEKPYDFAAIVESVRRHIKGVGDTTQLTE